MFARIYLEEKDDKVVPTKVYNNKMLYHPTTNVALKLFDLLKELVITGTAQKMKFSIKDLCSKYDQI